MSSSVERVKVVARAYAGYFKTTARTARPASHLDPVLLQGSDRGYLLIFRFGATVAFGLTEEAEHLLIESLGDSADRPPRVSATEETEVEILPDHPEGLSGNAIRLQSLSPPRMEILGNVLAKSAVLAHQEDQISQVFERIEPLAERLRLGKLPSRGSRILERLGETLLIQIQTVGRVEVSEKPELTWDDPDLYRLYERLASEYELVERDHALTRKLELIATVTGTYIDLLNTRRSLRVEWYILLLIAAEIIMLVMYEFLSQ